MNNVYWVLVILFICSFLGTWTIIKIAWRFSILDVPNNRSSHSKPTPRGGGLSISIIWFFLLGWLFFSKNIDKKLFFMLVSILPVSVASFIDDIKSISPKIRLFIHVFAAVSAVFIFNFWDNEEVNIKLFLILFVQIIIIVWFINLFNFMDGINGYLAMEGFFFFGALYLFVSHFLPFFFLIIIFGFMLWNFPKAKIFCGDVGSTLIGFNVVVFSFYYSSVYNISILIPVILSSLFWFDATVTLIRRFLKGDKLTHPHKKHAYQRLNQGGFSHVQVVIIGFTVNILILILLLFSVYFNMNLIIPFIIHLFILFLFLLWIDKKKKFE